MKTVFLFFALLVSPAVAAGTRPNIVIIYADDLGFGDPGCYGGTGAPTPHIDRLAEEGLRFTSGYAASATCTPSRFSLLSGVYPFRKTGTGILPGDAAMILEPGKTVLPEMLMKAGYTTGVVGKWHLGLGRGNIDWNGEIDLTPNDVGFTESFIMAATGDRVPTVYVRDRRVENLDPRDPIEVSYKQNFPGEPDGKRDRAALKMDWSHGHNMAVVNGIGRIGYMRGGKTARWVDENMGRDFAGEAVGFIERHKDKPFFLFFATHNVHVPRAVHPDFVGRSRMGLLGDAIVELDWQVGQVMAALERNGLDENTLVIFSSDNGPVLDDGYKDGAVGRVGEHKQAGPFRGRKYAIYEGGTRVPFITRWKGRVKPGVSDAIVGQVDFAASLAALVGAEIPEGTAGDSVNVLPALLGDSKTGRDHIVQHTQIGNWLALREGDWKLVAGMADNKPKELFNLAEDPGETKNLLADEPETAARLLKRLKEIRESGA